MESAGHSLWGYYLVRIDEKDYSAEIIPIRATAGHLNVLQFLEQGLCTNCFKLAGITPNPAGTLDVNVSIKHPFTNLNLTGFDVRGIAMFNGGHVFPASGLIVSDRTSGEGELVNADGYTALYNPSTVGHGLESYMKGKMATATAPNATLNGYKRFITDTPANTRNAFYAGGEIIVTFQVDMPDSPNPWIFGYAVDASWAPAINKPVDDPMTDFGPEANCPEAWKIKAIYTPSDGLTDCGGQVSVAVDVYDWLGKDDTHLPTVECPELFDGQVEAAWKADAVGYTTYETVVENTKNAPAGFYRCLVSKEAQENDPLKPWLDITAYQLHELEVVAETMMPPTASAYGVQPSAFIGEEIYFNATASTDNDCGNQSIVNYEWDWNGSGSFVPEPDLTSHAWLTAGIYNVQLRVTDNESETDVLDEPLEVAILPWSGTLNWAKRAGGASGGDYSLGITTLSDNSTVATGRFSGSATFGPGEANETVLTSAGSYDIFIARYNPDGTLAWAKRAGGAYNETSYGSTTLSDNSTVATGEFYDSATFGPGEPNQTVLTSTGGFDIFIARYNPTGTLAWAKRAGGASGDDVGNEITTLSDNSTVVTGWFYVSATFGPGEPNETILTSDGGFDIFIARYNPDGTLAWAKRAGGASGYDGGRGITMLSDNSTVVTGLFFESATFGPGEPNQTALTSDGGYDIFIARYNTDGTLAWAKRAGGGDSDAGFGITTLSDNSTVVTGYFYDSATFGPGEPNQTVLTSAGYFDIFIARYNPDGTLAWAKRAGGGSSENDLGNGITALSDNSTVVTGYFYDSATFGPGEPNQTVLTSAGYFDIFTARYNPDGTLAWAKRAGGASNDWGNGITTLSDNSTVATGVFSKSATFGPGEPNETVLTSAGDYDIFIARFEP